MQPLAIVIPAYKPTFLRQTLESIESQTNKDFTLYVGDDCSPHDIKAIVDEFKDKIPVVFHRFDTNLGGLDLVEHWTRCINLTQGEPYIWLFSDDDIMDPECVETFLNHIKTNPEDDLIHFNIRMIDNLDAGKIKPLPKFPKRMTAGEFLEAKLRGKIISFVVEFIFSRNLYNQVEGFQNFDLAWGSDFMTWLKMAAVSNSGIKTISSNNESLVNWRKSTENISPDNTHPILIRKIKALIGNAQFTKSLFMSSLESLHPLTKSFRWLRFPLGEIYRNRHTLSSKEILSLSMKYAKNVGYSYIALPFAIKTILSK